MFTRRSFGFALLLAAGATLASADTYSNSAAWISSVRTDFAGSSFDFVPVSNPFSFGPTNGYVVHISAANTGSPNVTQYQSFSPVIQGITPTNNLGTLVINVAGTRPANAFFMSAGIISGINLALTAGQIRVETDRGDAWTFSTAAGSTSFGATTSSSFRQLRVSWDGGSGLGNVFLDSLTIAQTNAIAHTDNCENALGITPGEWPIDNRGATTGPVGATCAPTIADVWYRYTAAADGRATITTAGSGFDTTVSVYTGDCGNPISLACNDDVGVNDLTSQVSFPTTAGTTYLVRIAGYQYNPPQPNSTGTGRLLLTQAANCAGDFNNSGAVSVQDIFDFLAAYFTGCP